MALTTEDRQAISEFHFHDYLTTDAKDGGGFMGCRVENEEGGE